MTTKKRASSSLGEKAVVCKVHRLMRLIQKLAEKGEITLDEEKKLADHLYRNSDAAAAMAIEFISEVKQLVKAKKQNKRILYRVARNVLTTHVHRLPDGAYLIFPWSLEGLKPDIPKDERKAFDLLTCRANIHYFARTLRYVSNSGRVMKFDMSEKPKPFIDAEFLETIADMEAGEPPRRTLKEDNSNILSLVATCLAEVDPAVTLVIIP